MARIFCMVGITVSILVCLSSCQIESKSQIELIAEDAYLSFAKGMISFISSTCEFLNAFRTLEFKSKVNPKELLILLYTSHSFTPFIMTNASNEIMEHPSFDINAMTMIYVHGFNGLPDSEELISLGAALSKKGNYNLLTLNGKSVLHGLDYIYTSGFTPHLGDLLFSFLSDLFKNGMLLKHVHLVGHSMGAQIVGYAARKFKDTFGRTLPRITALDPAAPCFTGHNLITLSPTDALYVDVLRTSILSYRDELIGHADYFVNGRNGSQPGCSLDINCSHGRANDIFVESATNERGFVAVKCRNVTKYDCEIDMGLSVAGFASGFESRGFYMLKTRDYPPYAMGMDRFWNHV